MTYRGGRVPATDNDSEDSPLRRLRRHQCYANGCPMTGSIFETIGANDRPGSCVWHYAIAAGDVPKVTSVLVTWLCVSQEIQTCRRVLTGSGASDSVVRGEAFTLAWQRLRPEVLAFEHDLEPQPTEDYGAWARRLEEFLGGQVRDVLSVRQRG